MTRQIASFLSTHAVLLGLLLTAFIATMPEELPEPFRNWPVSAWLYGWLHNGLRTFTNLRKPTPPQK